MGVGKHFLNPFCLMSQEQFPVDESGNAGDPWSVVLVHVAVDVLIV